MKKKIILFMAVVFLVFCNGSFFVQASEPYNYCPHCGTGLVSRGEHLDHWTVQRVFKDSAGASVICYESHSVDKNIRFCENGHGTVWSETTEKVSHSLPTCPYK